MISDEYQIELLKPDIRLHCTNEACHGVRFFRCTSPTVIVGSAYKRFVYLTYRCANCQRSTKTFALSIKLLKNGEAPSECMTLGEVPPFGPPTPSHLITLIGPDREDFLKGRRCENQGLGVGAFIYYRRVVENQKNRIVGEIIRVAERLGADEAVLAPLKAALDETQFSKALDMAKNAIPQTLLINGYNPLSLLHSALSDGVHVRTDMDCLELATSIRIVMTELPERLSQALKDEAGLTKAISHLANRKNA